MIRVIINGHNCKHFVKECIESVKAQNVPFRAIVVDDGSTDGTHLELIKHLDRRFELIVKQDNEGPAAARFRALEALQAHESDLVVLLDLDDRLNRLDALKMADNAKADVTIGSTLTKSGKALIGSYPDEVIESKSYREYPWRCFPLRTFRYGVYQTAGFTHEDFKYKKSVRINNKTYAKKGDWYKVCTDVALMFPIMEAAETLVHIPELLYFYNDIGTHVGRAKYPIDMWAETSKQINGSKRTENR